MLATLWDTIDDDGGPDLAEVVRLNLWADMVAATLAHIEAGTVTYKPDGRWLTLRLGNLIDRRIAAKPIQVEEIDELIAEIEAHGRLRQANPAADPHLAKRNAAVVFLQNMADRVRADTLGRRVRANDWRRRQLAAYGLLTAMVASPGVLAASTPSGPVLTG